MGGLTESVVNEGDGCGGVGQPRACRKAVQLENRVTTVVREVVCMLGGSHEV